MTDKQWFSATNIKLYTPQFQQTNIPVEEIKFPIFNVSEVFYKTHYDKDKWTTSHCEDKVLAYCVIMCTWHTLCVINTINAWCDLLSVHTRYDYVVYEHCLNV